MNNAALLSLLVAALAVAYFLTQPTPPPQPRPHTTPMVPRVILPQDDLSSTLAAKYDHPVVVADSFVRRWKALQWGASTFASLGAVEAYHNPESPRFGPYFDEGRPLSALPSVRPRHGYSVRHMSIEEVLEGPKHSYFTGSLPDALLQDMVPFADLLSVNPSATSINLWVGQPGVVAPCHYDGYHNYFVQLNGTKSFKLFPPSESSTLRPFPFLHPSHAQCQEVSRGATLTAVLHPGDVLYLPPLWFHEVTAVTASVSVNVWAAPREEALASALHATVPVLSAAQRDSLHTTDLLKALRAVVAMGEASGAATSTRYFLWEVYSTRYDALLESGELPASFVGRAPWVADTKREALACVAAGGDQATLAAFTKAAAALPPQTRHLWLGNAIEHAVAGVVGAANVGPVLYGLTLPC